MSKYNHGQLNIFSHKTSDDLIDQVSKLYNIPSEKLESFLHLYLKNDLKYKNYKRSFLLTLDQMNLIPGNKRTINKMWADFEKKFKINNIQDLINEEQKLTGDIDLFLKTSHSISKIKYNSKDPLLSTSKNNKKDEVIKINESNLQRFQFKVNECDGFCIVEHKKYSKNLKNTVATNLKNGKVYSITSRHCGKDVCLKKKLKGDFQVMPSTNKERDCVYISGPSGAGKTYWANKYINQYLQLYPSNKIILFSKKEIDEPDAPKNKIIHLNPTLEMFSEIDLKDFENSLVFFDDVENISSDKEVQNRLMKFMGDVLNVGRSFGISVIVVSHVMLNYRFTKNILSECNKIVMFPNSGSKHQYINYLKRYVGFEKEQITNLMNKNTRWICLNVSYPMYYVTQREIKIL